MSSWFFIFKVPILQRLAVTAILIVLAMSTSSARADQAYDEEIDQIVPGVKELRILQRSIDDKIAAIQRALDVLTLGGKGDGLGRSELKDSGPTQAERSPLAEISIEKSRTQLRKDLREALNFAMIQRRKLKRETQDQLRIYVKTGVDRCREAINRNDEVGARSACGVAERKIDQCKANIEPDINRGADRLTEEYKPIFGEDGDFSLTRVSCDVALFGLDRPASLLYRAGFRLAETSCYIHLDEATKFARTGSMPNRLGKDDVTVSAYLSFIDRMCSPLIALDARKSVDQALAARASADATAAASANAASAAQEATSDLVPLRRGGTEASTIFRDMLSQAKRGDRMPSAPDTDASTSISNEIQVRDIPNSGQSEVAGALQILSTTLDTIAAQRQQRDVAAARRQAQQLAQLEQVQKDQQRRQAEAQRQAEAAQREAQQLARLEQIQKDQQRRQAEAQRQAEAAQRWYPPLRCAAQSSKRAGNRTVACMKNNCGQNIEIHSHSPRNGWGMQTIRPGTCYDWVADVDLQVACEANDGFDAVRGMCQR